MHTVISLILKWVSKTPKTFCSFFSSIFSLLWQLECRMLDNRMNQLAKSLKLVTFITKFNHS